MNWNQIKTKWSVAWQEPVFRKKITLSTLSVATILAFLPYFFDWIEARQGILLDDWLLSRITPTDVSLGVFSLLWGAGLWLLFRAIQQPQTMLLFLAAYALLTVLRIITISIFPLEPPIGLIILQDPISNQFYGNTFITKDLFFSGHTSAVFLIGFTLTQRLEKTLVHIAACLVGLFVLILHIHYTIDVLVAPPLTYLCYRVAKKIVFR